jgi:hypothetical protein
MTKKYKVITLCGSTKFKEEFLIMQKELTLLGNIVISVGLFGHSGDSEAIDENTKEMLDDIHKRKIDMADGIFVINVGGYIGESTWNEIKYALALNKKVNFLEDVIRFGDSVKEKLISLYCPFCKTWYYAATEEDIKNSIRISCKVCGRSVILDDLLMTDVN